MVDTRLKIGYYQSNRSLYYNLIRGIPMTTAPKFQTLSQSMPRPEAIVNPQFSNFTSSQGPTANCPLPPPFLTQYPKEATIGGPLQNPWPPSTFLSSGASRASRVFESKTKGDQGIMIPFEISLIPSEISTLKFDRAHPAPFRPVPHQPSFLGQKQKVIRCSPKK